MRLFILTVLAMMFLISTTSRAEFEIEACKRALKFKVVDCQLSFSTSAKERKELIKKTYGIVRHITCSTHMNIKRYKVIDAFGPKRASGVTFSSHQINCGIQTNGDQFEIGLTLAPWIQFDDGLVSRLKLNIKSVTGVPSFIGKLLMKYGNAPQLQEKAKGALNSFLLKLYSEIGLTLAP